MAAWTSIIPSANDETPSQHHIGPENNRRSLPAVLQCDRMVVLGALFAVWLHSHLCRKGTSSGPVKSEGTMGHLSVSLALRQEETVASSPRP